MASAGNFSFRKLIPYTLNKLFNRTKKKDEKKIQKHCGCFSALNRLIGKKKKSSSAESEYVPQPCMCEEEVKYTSTTSIQEEEKIEALLPCQTEQEIGNDSLCIQEEEKIEAPIPCQEEQEICDNSICVQEEEKMEAPIPCQSEQEIGNNSTCIHEEKIETSITKVETEEKHEASNLRKEEEKKYASTTSTQVQETNQNCPKKKETNKGSTLCQKAEKPRNNNWIPELNLTQQHKMELRSNAWLDDIIIDAAQNLLQKQFGCEGLQSCIFSQLEFSPVYGPSVQIHYDSQRHHWLTSCFKAKQVEIADSLKTRVLPQNMKQQIQYCYRELVKDPASTIKVLDVDQQPNGYDCGVYAIANAYEFLSNGNPMCKYNNKEMRSHLIRCLESGEISAFPKRS